MVMVHPDGERSFIHYRGANAEFTPDDIDWSVIGDCAVFHLAGVYLMPQMDGEPAARVLQEAKRRGMITCLDTTWDASGQWMRLLQPCLPHLDYITPNYGEASMLTGETDPERIADRLLAEGVGTAVIKMDAQGCFVKNREVAFHLPACTVEVVDMLGAGDCFTAGWLAGVSMGWDCVAQRAWRTPWARCVSPRSARPQACARLTKPCSLWNGSVLIGWLTSSATMLGACEAATSLSLSKRRRLLGKFSPKKREQRVWMYDTNR
jgi:Sugar kinases, ribokinase family